jgi:cell division septal protein FtsQ
MPGMPPADAGAGHPPTWRGDLLDRRNGTGKLWRTKRRRRTSRMRPQSASRFETTAHAGSFVIGTRTPRTRQLVKEWERQRPRPQGRRSRTRLGQARREARYQSAVTAVRAVATLPSRTAVRLNLRLAFNVLMLGILVWAIAWLFVADRFYVDQVVVTGNERVPTDAIVSASGLQGYSVFWINSRQVAAHIVEALPPLRTVHIQCTLPNQVTLEVQEEGDQVMWEVLGKRYWVDEQGALHLAEGGGDPALLVKDIRAELPQSIDPKASAAAQQITHLLPELRVIEYAPATGLRFTHSRGWVVYLGTADNMVRKISILRAMEVQYANQETDTSMVVDLRFPESPYYRLPTPSAGGQ